MLEHRDPAGTSPARVVIVGAGGFIGSTIARLVAAEGVPLLALTRKDADLLAPEGEQKLRERLRAADSVVFVSAIAPAKTTAMLMQNLQMADAACRAFAAAPSTIHGMMHAAREMMLKNASPAPFAALRPTLIYGAADPHNGYGPNRFRRQAAKGEAITIFGEGEERRDHVHVEDVARLAVLMLRRRSVGALNAVTGRSVSFHDVAHLVAGQFTPRVAVASVPRPGPRPHLTHRHFDITQCLKAFPGFRYTELAQGIARVHRETVERG